MKINRLFSIAAAALMMVACSSEDTALKNTPAAGPQMQFTATIAAPGSGATRTEYTESGTDINVAWKVGDEIALIHGNVRDVATVKTINADGSATINGYVTGATDEADVQLYYPAARMISNGQGGFTFDPVIEGKKLTQDGTLKYIQDNLDFREGEGKLSVNGTEVTLKEPVKMAAENAIWKLALKDDAETPAALAASQLAIMIGSDTIASTAILSTAASTVYLAVPGMADKAITIGATVDEDTYAYKKEGVTLASGKYYQSTVNMSMVKTIDLSELQGDCEAKNGYTLTGTLGANVKITIAAGATVTLDGVTINGVNSLDYKWAGITCEGAATIILKDETTNKVTGFSAEYPGIYVPSGNTLTIKGETKGTGSLNASSNGNGAGIGGGYGNSINCGNIVIEGGDITATGSSYAAGIGSASNTSCGDITISGGTITANGGEYAAGIGTGYTENAYCGDITISGGTVTATGGENGAGIGTGKSGSCNNITISGGTVSATGGENAAGIGSGSNWGDCGNITITTGVTKVTATKGSDSPNSIGAGKSGSCGTVTIAGVVGAISTSPYTYPVPAPIALSAVTSSQLGWIVGNDGKAYAVEPLPAGVDAVAKIFYVGTTGDATYNHGLALALADEGKMEWSTAGTTCSGKNTSTPITGAKWLLASKDQWDYMMGANGAGSWSNLKNKAGLINDFYWSSSPGSDDDEAKGIDFYGGNWSETLAKTGKHYVRACLAF